MSQRLFLIIFTLLACACKHTPEYDAHTTINPHAIERALKPLVDDETLVGVSALVYQDHQEVFYGAYGMADRERQLPIKRDTLFQLYSMTKPLTGAVLMTLYDEGLFDLNAPLSQYLPEFADVQVLTGIDSSGEPMLAPPARPVTVLDTLRHTAGWSQWGNDAEQPYMTTLWQKLDPMNRDLPSEVVRQRLAQMPLLFHPGERWYYGMSVDIQALLAEKLTGKPFAQLLQERLLDPLKMHSTGYFIAPQDRERLSAVYIRDEQGQYSKEQNAVYEAYFKPWRYNPGGQGLASSLDDYMRFARMLLNGGTLDGVRILQPETVQLMVADHLPEDVGDKSWLPSKGQVGFGINFAVRIAPPASEEEGAGVVGEYFWDGWTNTLFFVDPKNKITAVLMTHYYPFGGTPVQKRFRDAVYSNIPEAHYQH